MRARRCRGAGWRNMPVRVFLADLRYNYAGILANDCMPLGIAYMKAVMDAEDGGRDIQSRLFVYPDRLLDELKAAPPDVLMVSNYVWNERLSHEFCRILKQLRPDALTVMGGPNISLETERQAAYLERRPEIDVYVLGEGDFRAHEVVRTYIDAGLSRKPPLRATIPRASCREFPG